MLLKEGILLGTDDGMVLKEGVSLGTYVGLLLREGVLLGTDDGLLLKEGVSHELRLAQMSGCYSEKEFHLAQMSSFF